MATEHRLYDEFVQLRKDDSDFANLYDENEIDFHAWVMDYEVDADWN